MPEPRPRPQPLDAKQAELPREVIISTPDDDAIADAVLEFVRWRLLRRAREVAKAQRLSD